MGRLIKTLGLSALAVMLVTLAAMPGPVLAADHLDAPGLTSPGGSGRTDIADLYAMKDGSDTALIQTVNPLTAPGTNPGFHQTATYEFVVDQNGDAKDDLTYRVTFGPQQADGRQWLTLQRKPALGGGSIIGEGWTGTDIAIDGGGTVRADQFDDPFFFDLIAFLGAGGRSFCDGIESDTLAGSNVSAIVLKVPAATVSGAGDSHVGIWARTVLDGAQVDRMGFPAINTVFIPSSVKNQYNATKPRKDIQKFGQYLGPFADVLLPDILPLDVSSGAGFLNGRQPSDDVIDAELQIITGDPGAGDCVDGNDKAFPVGFPYLAPKN
jgi:hypothetical protein